MLRDDEHIAHVLIALMQVWEQNRGMRLTQLVNRIAEVDPSNPSDVIQYDPTYVDDDEWVRKAERYPY